VDEQLRKLQGRGRDLLSWETEEEQEARDVAELRAAGLELGIPDAIEAFLDSGARAKAYGSEIPDPRREIFSLLCLSLVRRAATVKTNREKAMAGDWPLDGWTPKDMDTAVAALEVERKIQMGEWPLWESPEDVKATILAMADCWRDEWTDLTQNLDNESAARIVLGLESVDRVRGWKVAWKKGKDKLLRNLVGDGKGTLTKGVGCGED